MMVIEQGLGTDDRVIVEGLLQAIPGRKVKPEPAAATTAATSAQAHD